MSLLRRNRRMAARAANGRMAGRQVRLDRELPLPAVSGRENERESKMNGTYGRSSCGLSHTARLQRCLEKRGCERGWEAMARRSTI